jgi:hypothetical protein
MMAIILSIELESGVDTSDYIERYPRRRDRSFLNYARLLRPIELGLTFSSRSQ